VEVFVDLVWVRKREGACTVNNFKEKKRKVYGATVRNCHTLQVFYFLFMMRI